MVQKPKHGMCWYKVTTFSIEKMLRRMLFSVPSPIFVHNQLPTDVLGLYKPEGHGGSTGSLSSTQSASCEYVVSSYPWRPLEISVIVCNRSNHVSSYKTTPHSLSPGMQDWTCTHIQASHPVPGSRQRLVQDFEMPLLQHLHGER